MSTISVIDIPIKFGELTQIEFGNKTAALGTIWDIMNLTGLVHPKVLQYIIHPMISLTQDLQTLLRRLFYCEKANTLADFDCIVDDFVENVSARLFRISNILNYRESTNYSTEGAEELIAKIIEDCPERLPYRRWSNTTPYDTKSTRSVLVCCQMMSSVAITIVSHIDGIYLFKEYADVVAFELDKSQENVINRKMYSIKRMEMSIKIIMHIFTYLIHMWQTYHSLMKTIMEFDSTDRHSPESQLSPPIIILLEQDLWDSLKNLTMLLSDVFSSRSSSPIVYNMDYSKRLLERVSALITSNDSEKENYMNRSFMDYCKSYPETVLPERVRNVNNKKRNKELMQWMHRDRCPYNCSGVETKPKKKRKL